MQIQLTKSEIKNILCGLQLAQEDAHSGISVDDDPKEIKYWTNKFEMYNDLIKEISTQARIPIDNK